MKKQVRHLLVDEDAGSIILCNPSLDVVSTEWARTIGRTTCKRCIRMEKKREAARKAAIPKKHQRFLRHSKDELAVMRRALYGFCEEQKNIRSSTLQRLFVDSFVQDDVFRIRMLQSLLDEISDAEDILDMRLRKAATKPAVKKPGKKAVKQAKRIVVAKVK